MACHGFLYIEKGPCSGSFRGPSNTHVVREDLRSLFIILWQNHWIARSCSRKKSKKFPPRNLTLSPRDPITFWEWQWNLNNLLRRWLYTPIIIWQGDWILREESVCMSYLKGIDSPYIPIFVWGWDPILEKGSEFLLCMLRSSLGTVHSCPTRELFNLSCLALFCCSEI